MTQPLPPDTEAIAVDYLSGVAAVTAIFGSRIGTSLDPTVSEVPLPALRITLISTLAAAHRRLDGALLQLDAWGATKEAANDGIRTARAAMLDEEAIVGVYPTLGVVTGVAAGAGPRWNPEPEVGLPRYVTDVRLYARPE